MCRYFICFVTGLLLTTQSKCKDNELTLTGRFVKNVVTYNLRFINRKYIYQPFNYFIKVVGNVAKIWKEKHYKCAFSIITFKTLRKQLNYSYKV